MHRDKEAAHTEGIVLRSPWFYDLLMKIITLGGRGDSGAGSSRPPN